MGRQILADPNFPPANERGAALLTVLLLVAVMAVISATALDRLRLSTRLAVNGAAMSQARHYSLVAENVALSRIEDLLANDAGQVTNVGGWLNRDIPFPVDRGSAMIRLSDGQNCFNINSLVNGKEGQYVANRRAISQLSRLFEFLGIPTADAVVVAESAADWIDSDSDSMPSGAEDNYYRALNGPYVTANRLFIDSGELGAIRGMTPGYQKRLKPWICALPVAEPVQLNVNTLDPDRAIMLASIVDGKITPSQAKALLAIRPPAGYGSAIQFWSLPQLAAAEVPEDVKNQVGVTSGWFFVNSRVSAENVELESQALLQVSGSTAQILWHKWGGA